MSNEKIRQYLSLSIVSSFLLIVVFLFVMIIIGYMDVDTGKELIKSLMTVFSGFIGVILGHYFAQSSSITVFPEKVEKK